MSTVMTFWQAPSDEAAFFEYLSREDVIVYPSEGFSTEAELAPISLSEYIRLHPGKKCLLSLRSLRGDVITHSLVRDGQCLFAINPSRNSVVDYTPGVLKDGTLTITNVFAFWNALRDGALVKKNDAFCKWGKRIFKWLRKRVKPLQQGALFPMTTDAEEAA